MSRKRTPETRAVDLFSTAEGETTLCVIVQRPMAALVEQMYDTGLWGRNLPEVCERIISSWLLANLENLARLGIEIEL